MGFYKSFESGITRVMTPIANKVDNQPHLSAIKAGMVAMTPFTILGSFFSIIPALPNMIGENNPVSQWIISNEEFLNLPVQFSIGMIGLFACLAIAYNLGNHYKLYIPGCITLSAFAYLFMTTTFTADGALDFANFGAKGLFTAMLCSIITVELYRFTKAKNLTIRMPEGVPDFVSKSFELITVTLIVAGTFIIARFGLLETVGHLPPTILTAALAPLVGSMDNPFAVLFVHFISVFVFFFGIHPSILGPVLSPIRVQFIAENIAAMDAGLPLPHFYTAGTSSAFFGFTGAGISIGCIIACLISRSAHYRKIGKVSLFPALFGINEPILFGAPIILNPIMFIPHVFGGAIIGTLPMFFMHWGWLDKPIFDPPYVGIFLEGFLTSGDWRVIPVQALQLILAVLIYLPFFKIMEKQELAKRDKEKDIKEVFNAQQEDLLAGMDLDF